MTHSNKQERITCFIVCNNRHQVLARILLCSLSGYLLQARLLKINRVSVSIDGTLPYQTGQRLCSSSIHSTIRSLWSALKMLN